MFFDLEGIDFFFGGTKHKKNIAFQTLLTTYFFLLPFMHDLLCIGLGPAACTTAIYTARYKMNTMVIGAIPGGQMALTTEIENYPGFNSILGRDLGQRMIEQMKENGAEVVYDTIQKVEKTEEGFIAHGMVTGEHKTKILLLATGTSRRKLGVPGEKEFYGKGVTYCATCDGMFYKEQDVAVVGGGNSAAEAALYLSDICKSVRIIIRKNHFRADQILVEKILKRKNITVEFERKVMEIKGKEKVTEIILDNGEVKNITGIFIEIGADPNVELANQLGIKLDKENYIIVDSGQRTSVLNVLAAGDNTTASEKFAQDATAVGEGAIAAKSAHEIYQHQ